MAEEKSVIISLAEKVSVGALRVFTSPFTEAVGKALKLPSEEQLVKRIKDTPSELEKEIRAISDTIFNLAKKGGMPGFFATLAAFQLELNFLTKGSSGMINPLIEKRFSQPAMAAFRPGLLDPSQSVTAEYRELEEDYKADNTLKLHGYSDKDIEILKKLHLYIPGAGDIIRFSVREAYSEKAVAEFKMDEGFDDILAAAGEDIKKAGLPIDTLRKLWRAHWVLPSPMQGFEMLHRDKINPMQLDLLLKTLDVMPFWREKLKDIVFNPYTRVDVRRMHKLGVLTLDQVKRSYLDLGFDEDKASNMTLFTEKYNADPEEQELTFGDREQQANRELTKTDILRGYNAGLIPKEDSVFMLEAIGYSTDSAEFYILREEYKLEEDRTDRYIKFYQSAFVRGLWDKNKTLAALGELNLPGDFQEYLLDIWELEKEIKVTLPSKSEIMGFYRRDIITEETAKEELSKHGYSDKYIGWYLSGIKKEVK